MTRVSSRRLRTLSLLAALASLAASAQAAGYQYYLTDNLAAIDKTKWLATGPLTPSGLGLASADANGGSLISLVPIPDATSEAEVSMNVTLNNSGGNYTEFLQATPGALTGLTGAGTYIAFEMQNPRFDATRKNCTANFMLFQGTGSTISLLAAFQHSCRNGMTLRLAVHGAVALVWPDQATPMEFVIAATGAGQPGIGTYGTPTGNSISLVQLGAINRTAPAAVNQQKIAVSAFGKHIDLKWPAIPGDANGSPLAGYWIYRDGLYFARTLEPNFSDETVASGQTHTYTISTVDQHYNFAPAASVTATAPKTLAATSLPPLPAGIKPVPLPGSKTAPTANERAFSSSAVQSGTPAADSGNGNDPRRVGVRALGSYWGDAGEQIDTLSGNLNFSVPLIKPQSRGGWGLSFALSYNSQMWRQDSGTETLLGQDVGYGFGWKLQAGSITPIWNGTSNIDHYLYTDSTGAEYSLNQNNNDVWTSVEGVYVTYDHPANALNFNDGSNWWMGTTSSAGEPDAGTLYPCQITDSNGNTIVIYNLPGAGSSSGWSSARIGNIWDPRVTNGGASYTFSYSNEATPHIATIVGPTGTPESYTFYYQIYQTISGPFSGQPLSANPWLLQQIVPDSLTVSTSFQYTGSGEMSQMTTPLGGNLYWYYRTFNYPTGITLREVATRSVAMQGYPSTGFNFSHDDGSTVPAHMWTALYDVGANSWKFWEYNLSSPDFATASAYYELTPNAGPPVPGNWNPLISKGYGWGTDSANNQYLSSVVTIPNYNGPPTATVQTKDAYGNVTQSQVYDYGQAYVSRTYNYTYLTGANYTARYIRNRLQSATVTTTGAPITLVTNTYDSSPLTDRPSLMFHNTGYSTSFPYRGNLTASATPGAVRNTAYDIGGVAVSANDGNGHSITITPSDTVSDMTPAALTPNNNSSFQTTASYNSALAPTSITQPNSNITAYTYDSIGRVATATSPYGAVTTYSYYPASQQTIAVTTPVNRWQRTTTDGFGRAITVETGSGTTAGTDTMTTVDTVYAPCACSPLGKMSQVSQPYAPSESGNRVWTSYTYDASGRTLSIKVPDGSITTYSYSQNMTTVTDPAGHWKQYTTDAMGNLTQVLEQDPAGSSGLPTNYTYDIFNHLSGVSMPRAMANGTVTQTRTFAYDSTTARLNSVTTPESGTVTYAYNGDGTLASKTDAKGQQTRYTYDTYQRVTETDVYPNGQTMDSCQSVFYKYDGAIEWSSQLNGIGRLTSIWWSSANCASSFSENYAYYASGKVWLKQLAISNPNGGPSVTLTGNFSYDPEGRLSGYIPPGTNSLGQAFPAYSYSRDALGRATGMATSSGQQLVSNATYDGAGMLLSKTVNGQYTETRAYNPNQQLTNLVTSGPGQGINLTYNYPAANNGRIASMADGVSGEMVTYRYNELNQLTQATNSSTWGTDFGYDGFGNLQQQSQMPHLSGPSMSLTVDPTTNRISTSGYAYDANGNLTQTPDGQTYGYDGANRMVSNGASYNPGNQRVWDGAYLYYYGVQGELLGKYQPLFNLNSSGSQLIGDFGLYFNGQLIQQNIHGSVATDRLGSVRANSSGERFNYYPYGTEIGGDSMDGRTKFGTYTRDSAGLDYAMNRYYNPLIGRFYTEDPTMNNVDYSNPQSWNAYSYGNGDPGNFNDPSGLVTCGGLGVQGGSTLSSYFNTTSNAGILTEFVWAEGGTLAQNDDSQSALGLSQLLVAQAVENRLAIANGQVAVTGANGNYYWGSGGTFNGFTFLSVSVLGYGGRGTTLAQEIVRAAGGTTEINAHGQLNDMSGLMGTLSEDQGDPTRPLAGRVPVALVGGGIDYVTPQCDRAVSAMQATNTILAGGTLNQPGFFVTSWKANLNSNPDPTRLYDFGSTGGTTFYGFGGYSFGQYAYPPIRKPPPTHGRRF